MFQHHFLHRRPHHHVFFHRFLLLQAAVVSRPAHRRQLTHPFHTQTALHRHHSPDLVVDAFAPVLPSPRRRASILCKAPLKKSNSNTFSARARFNRSTSLASTASRSRLASGCLSGSSRCRHRYNPRRSTPSSLANVPVFSPCFIRSTATRQNSSPRYFAPLTFATRSSFPAKCAFSHCLTFRGHSTFSVRSIKICVDALSLFHALLAGSSQTLPPLCPIGKCSTSSRQRDCGTRSSRSFLLGGIRWGWVRTRNLHACE